MRIYAKEGNGFGTAFLGVHKRYPIGPEVTLYFILDSCLLLAHKHLTIYRLQTQLRMSQTRDIYHPEIGDPCTKSLKNAIRLIEIVDFI